MENQFNTSIKAFQSDGGTEFTNNKMQELLQQNGILHTMSCPHTPAQNGKTCLSNMAMLAFGPAILSKGMGA